MYMRKGGTVIYTSNRMKFTTTGKTAQFGGVVNKIKMKLKLNWNITPLKSHKQGGIKQYRKNSTKQSVNCEGFFFILKYMFCSTK